MKTITLTDNEGGNIRGQVPQGWHEVPLSVFLAYNAAMKGKPEALAGLVACSVLTSLPAEVLNSDVSLVPIILPHMPWLSHLPEPEPHLVFEHAGHTYEHVGNLDKIDAGQFEALHTFLEQAEESPVQAAPYLLAVLYRQKGKAQDAASIQANAEAFQSLSMDTAWGAVAFFLSSSASAAGRIASFGQAKAEALQTVTKMEASLKAAPSQTRSSRMLARLARAYTRSAREQLLKL